MWEPISTDSIDLPPLRYLKVLRRKSQQYNHLTLVGVTLINIVPLLFTMFGSEVNNETETEHTFPS